MCTHAPPASASVATTAPQAHMPRPWRAPSCLPVAIPRSQHARSSPLAVAVLGTLALAPWAWPARVRKTSLEPSTLQRQPLAASSRP
eukprot:scaffold12195_cov164-Isochrysis_galbana.AAC.1